MLNIRQAACGMYNNQTLALKDGQFVRCDVKETAKRVLMAGHDKKQIRAIAQFIQNKLAVAQDSEKQDYLELANAFVKCYSRSLHGDKIAQVFDRNIVVYKDQIDFANAENKSSFSKWVRNGMPESLYHKHQDFCQFIEASGLLSQMKVTRDTAKEINGEPSIIVNGKWMPWSEIKKNFEYVDSVRYHERFVVHKESRLVYTYLDNGKGLQQHHPFTSEMAPTTVLNDEEYGRVLATAHKFVRPGEEELSLEKRAELNQDRTFVIQVVTSYVKGPNTRAHDLLQNRKHPYLRLIVGVDVPEKNLKKGDVIEVGYGWKNKMSIPLVTTEGQFRSPDVWEYMPCEEKVVTNMPVTREEAKAFSEYTLKYHRDQVNLGNPIGFHLSRQNCSTYVRASLAVAGIKVPTEIGLKELINRVTPLWISKVIEVGHNVVHEGHKLAGKAIKILPKSVQNGLTKAALAVDKEVKKIMGVATALTLAPANIALGGGFGEGGAAFVGPSQNPTEIKPVLSDWKNWFKISSYSINLPGILQEWQRKQESTVVTKKPIKLAVVPPKD